MTFRRENDMLRAASIIFLTLSLLIGLLSFMWQTPSAQSAGISAGKLAIVVSQINLPTNDIIYDPVSKKIYASTPSTAGIYANSIVPVDVPAGVVGEPVFVGSEPNKLASSDDGQYLYVALDGAYAVRRFNLISQTAELQFSLGTAGSCGSIRAEDMVVLKGNPNAVAISLQNTNCSPRHEGVAIYDDGVRRPISTPDHTGSNAIEPSDSDSILYGLNNETTEFGFRVMSVISSGVVITSVTSGVINGFGTNIRFSDGLIYATTGATLNPATGTVVGTYAGRGAVYPDSSTGRVYFLSTDPFDGVQLKVFDQDTFTLIDIFSIPGVSGSANNLIKAGENLLAFRTTGGQIFFIKLVELNYSVYVPLTYRACSPGICGQVSLNGAPVVHLLLELRFFDGTNWDTFASTYTDVNGKYSFTGVPDLAPGQLYYVLYQNNGNIPGRLAIWGTRLLTSYSTGSNASIGNFDITDISLDLPAYGDTVALPYTFQWTPRSATPSDTYEFDLFDLVDGNPYFFTIPPLGYVGAYTLNSLPPGFNPDTPYWWEIWVYSMDGGSGISHRGHSVFFSNTGINVNGGTQPVGLKTMPVWEDQRKR